MKIAHVNIQSILQEAKAVILNPIRGFAFEISAQTHDDYVRRVTFSQLRENVLKVSCSGETGIFFIPRTTPEKIGRLLRVLQRFGFVHSFKRISVESFEVVLLCHPVSKAA